MKERGTKETNRLRLWRMGNEREHMARANTRCWERAGKSSIGISRPRSIPVLHRYRLLTPYCRRNVENVMNGFKAFSLPPASNSGTIGERDYPSFRKNWGSVLGGHGSWLRATFSPKNRKWGASRSQSGSLVLHVWNGRTEIKWIGFLEEVKALWWLGSLFLFYF